MIDRAVTDMTDLPLDMLVLDSKVSDTTETLGKKLTQNMSLETDIGSELESDALTPKVDNVLIIIANCLGLDAINGFGLAESTASTPTIDALCEGGLRFHSAYSHPTCSLILQHPRFI